jgi:hypothetical protein
MILTVSPGCDAEGEWAMRSTVAYREEELRVGEYPDEEQIGNVEKVAKVEEEVVPLLGGVGPHPER